MILSGSIQVLHLVDLSKLKLNRGLAVYLRRCADAAKRGETLSPPPARLSIYTAPKRHLRDRLATDEVEHLVASYLSGVRRRELAERYGLSMSSVARLLRRSGALPRRTKALGG
jgi:hypothetical protein